MSRRLEVYYQKQKIAGVLTIIGSLATMAIAPFYLLAVPVGLCMIFSKDAIILTKDIDEIEAEIEELESQE